MSMNCLLNCCQQESSNCQKRIPLQHVCRFHYILTLQFMHSWSVKWSVRTLWTLVFFLLEWIFMGSHSVHVRKWIINFLNICLSYLKPAVLFLAPCLANLFWILTRLLSVSEILVSLWILNFGARALDKTALSQIAILGSTVSLYAFQTMRLTQLLRTFSLAYSDY